MINQKEIKKFLNRKLNNYDWLKDEKDTALQAAIDALKPRPQLPKLWRHQKACFLLVEAIKRFMLHVDMGGGKTLLTLSILKYRKQRGETPKAVVFVPYISAVMTWIDEVEKHTPDLKCVPLTGTSEQNLDVLANVKGDLYVICYQSALAMLWEPPRKNKKRKKPPKRKWSVKSATVRAAFTGFDMLVMDEIHKTKSASSLYYRMCRAISAQCEYVIGLTGTPFGKDLSDLWPQFYLIDFGETLGPTLGFFEEVFYNKAKVRFSPTNSTYKKSFKKEMFADLQRMIKHSSIRYGADEFADMPPKKFIRKPIMPNEGIHAYVMRAKATMRAALASQDEENKYRAIESNYLMLRQLASGFMTLRGENSDRVQVKFDENPKLEALQELVEALPLDRKMIVFHHFVYTNQLISERLTAMGIKHARVYGKQKDPIGELRRFKTNPKCRVLVLNSKSGSSSLNLQLANYVVFFEQPDNPIDRKQAIARVWRPGQTQRVFLYDLLMAGTMDEGMRASNRAGEDMLTALLDGRVKI